MKTRRMRAGFTLVEVVIVVLVVAVLSTAVLVGGSISTSKAKQRVAQSDLHNYEVSINALLSDTPRVAKINASNKSTEIPKLVTALNELLPTGYQIIEDRLSTDNTGSVKLSSGALGEAPDSDTGTHMAYKTARTDPWGNSYYVVFECGNVNAKAAEFRVFVTSAGKNAKTYLSLWDTDSNGTLNDTDIENALNTKDNNDDIVMLSEYISGETTSSIHVLSDKEKSTSDMREMYSTCGYTIASMHQGITYTVTWKNYNGAVLGTSNVLPGTVPAYTGAAPTRAADAEHTYTFTGWSPKPAATTNNTIYTAQFSTAPRTYTITWKNANGTTLGTSVAAYGTTPTYSGATPTRPSDETYLYTFSGWTPSVVAATAPATYMATYSQKAINETYFSYSVHNGEVTIEGLSAAGEAAGSITEFPATIDGRSVTAVANGAFQGKTNVAFTSLPTSINEIGDYAFAECFELALTSLPNSVTHIGEHAFGACENVTLTSLPSSLTSLSSSAFEDCTGLALTSLPSGLTTIGENAFSGCSSLALTALPSGLTSIGRYAFSGCSSMTLTALPSGLTSISNGTFYNCTNLALTSLPSGLVSIGPSAFKNCTNLALSALPSNVTSIGASAFSGCTSLTITTIPWSTTSIGNYAFAFDSNVNVTETPCTYGTNAFAGTMCSSPAVLINWTSAQAAEVYRWTTDGDEITITELSTTWNTLNTIDTIPDAIDGKFITVIAEESLSEYDIFTFTSLPRHLTTIEKSAFEYCENLALTSLPSSVTSIGTSAFKDCPDLALTSLPSGITSIGASTFAECTNLALTSLPSGVTSIGGQAFRNCANLALTSLPSGLVSIGPSAFKNCTSLALTSLPSGVTTIAISAFENCTNLALTSLPSGVTTLANFVFKNCTHLALSSLRDGTTTIGTSTFEGCTGITISAIPGTVTTIGTKAFYNASSVNVTRVPCEYGTNAFYGTMCANPEIVMD